MVYKELIKFTKQEDYDLAKEYLRELVRDSEGSCVFDGERDHYENGTKDIKINSYHNELKISAECKLKDDENFLEKKLREFEKN